MKKSIALTVFVLGVAAGLLVAAGFGRADEPDRKALESELKKACEARELDRVDALALKLADEGGAEGVKALVTLARRIPPGDEGVYWRLVRGAASVRDEAGVLGLADAILDAARQPISRDLLFRFQSNRSPRAVKLHARILAKAPADLRLLSVDQLTAIEVVETVDVLIESLKREEKGRDVEVRDRILRALQNLTGADCGAASNWEKWWETARAQGLKRKGTEATPGETGTVVDDLEGNRAWEYPILEKLKPGDILVFKTDCKKDPDARACNFDAIEDVLERMRIPHTVALKKDLDSGKVSLDGAKVVVVTCTMIRDHCVCPTCVPGGPQNKRLFQCTGCDKHDVVNHRFSMDSIKKIRAWVDAGGYLFTEDWGIEDVLVRAWGTVQKKSDPNNTGAQVEHWTGSFVTTAKYLKELKVDVVPARGRTSHPLLRGLFVEPRRGADPGDDPAGGDIGTAPREPGATDERPGVERFWKIDRDSPAIKVVSKDVTVLMTSGDLRQLADGDDAVAVTFLPRGGPETADAAAQTKLRGGRVLHVLSHFGKQGSQDDEYALQNLLLNFLLEANRRAAPVKVQRNQKPAR